MSNIISSKLDPAQIIRKSYDESGNRIRVDAEINNIEVAIDVTAASGDNIAITSQDGTKTLNINPDGSINTNAGNQDAFGRTRVSELFTLGDYKHIYGIDPNFVDRVANGGLITFINNKSCATLSTTSNTLSYALHQTKFYHHYQPGKSQIVLSSVCFGYAQKNVTKRTGYMDDRDGIYFEQVGSNTSAGINNGQLNFVIRSYVDGSASEAAIGSYLRRVPQNLWNKDKCDGTGISGFNVNTSKTQLIYIDFQWLGVGRVRVGFVHNGQFIIAHEYYHSNIIDTVYLSNPNLPVRCEIFNTGITSGGSMDQICSTVSSEGGYVESGIDWAISGALRTTATPGRTQLPVLAIRLKNSFNGYPNRMSIRPNSISLFVETESIESNIIKLPNVLSLSTTLNGGVLTWISVDDNSGVEYCINATTYVSANADRFIVGYFPAGSSQNSLSPAGLYNLILSKKNMISQNIDSNNSEIYVISVKTIKTGNISAGVAASIQWREIY